MQIVQVTDLHLFADPDARLKDVPTRAAVREVLDAMRKQFPDCDYLIITGDLAHDEVRETYVALREILGDWVARCRILPGNHDNRAAMRDVFPEVIPAGEGAIGFAETAGAWRLLGLDSHVPGEVPGRIASAQLDWLSEQLAANAGAPTVLFVHHPAISVGSPWLDEIGLKQPERFIDIVRAAPQIKLICVGHIHQEFQGALGRAALLAAPSASVQFAPNTETMRLDPVPPGFRVLALEDGETHDAATFQTRVIRLPELTYPPQATER